jgi:hypothetical protein
MCLSPFLPFSSVGRIVNPRPIGNRPAAFTAKKDYFVKSLKAWVHWLRSIPGMHQRMHNGSGAREAMMPPPNTCPTIPDPRTPTFIS